MVYKSLNGLAPDILCQIFLQLSDVHNRVLRNSKRDLAIPLIRTAYGQNSFAYRGANLWNNLNNDVKLASSIQSFKAKYKAHNRFYSRKAILSILWVLSFIILCS